MIKTSTANRLMQKTGCLLLALGITALSHAQAPANDECTGAVSLTVNSTCIPVNGTTIGATQSTTLPDPDCGDVGSFDDDVWYTFTPGTGQTAVTIDFTSVSGEQDLVAQIYTSDDNTCSGTFTTFNCSDDQVGSLPGFVNLAVTEGTTYYIRVFSYSTDPGVTGTSNFTVCVRTPLTTPPANDDCSGAVALTVSPGTNCTSPTSGTTEAATASTETPPNTGASGTNDDVWYSFTATAATHKIELSNFTGTTNDMVIALYSGTCGALTLVGDSDPEIAVFNNLTPTEQYYVRIYTYTSSATDYAGFNICVTTPTPPANDDCGGAVALSVSPSGTCTTAMSGTTEGATQSAEAAPVTAPNGTNDDVWYSFVATAAMHRIVLSNTNGTTGDMVMGVYSGSCGSLTLLQDSDPETLNITGLTPGQTYYVRVWTYSDAPSDFASFDICVTTLTPPPNDDCATAIPITGTSGMVAGTNNGASQSQAPAACNSSSATASSDVWYSVTADFTGDINVEVDQSDLDAVTETFSGTCGNLVQLDCADGSNLTIAATAGETYYLRVDGWNNQQGNFGIQVTGTALPVTMGKLSGNATPDGTVRLGWTTYMEQHNKGFDIERSGDGKQFEKIGFVKSSAAEGNSKTALNYEYTDRDKPSGNLYYRLMQIDNDGKFVYSNIVRLSAVENKGFDIAAAPNPVKNTLAVNTYGTQGSNAVLQVVDLTGKVLRNVPVKGRETQIDMNGLVQGLYLIRYSDTEHNRIIKINKQ